MLSKTYTNVTTIEVIPDAVFAELTNCETKSPKPKNGKMHIPPANKVIIAPFEFGSFDAIKANAVAIPSESEINSWDSKYEQDLKEIIFRRERPVAEMNSIVRFSSKYLINLAP